MAAGNTDLRALGFWAVVKPGQTRPPPGERARRSDRPHRHGRVPRGVRLRAPVWLGNALLVVATVVGALAVGAAFVWQTPLWKGLAMIAAGAIWAISVHAPTHWLVGTIVGIRWTDYFLGGPPPPRPGLKSDYGSYLRADPDPEPGCMRGRDRHEARPVLALAVWPARVRPGGRRPCWPASVCCRSRPTSASARSPATGRSFVARRRSRGNGAPRWSQELPPRNWRGSPAGRRSRRRHRQLLLAVPVERQPG